MPTLPQIVESELNDFVRAMERKRSKTLTDIFTPNHPLFMMLEKHGGVTKENPGQGPVRDVRYARVRRTKKLSRTQKTVEREKADSQTTTTAQYQWVMHLNTLFVDRYTFLNTQGGDAQVKYLSERMDERDMDMKIQMVEDLWSGDTVGSTAQFGLQDFIQFDPTSDPARGAIGGLSVAEFPTWANQYANFNAAYATYTGGAQVSTFLDTGTNSLGTLYRNCSNNPLGTMAEGQPNLIAANEAMIRYCEGLARAGLLMKCGGGTNDFGIDGFRFKNAIIYWDPDCPNDPNDSSYGVGFLINTRSLEVVYAKGLERMVDDRDKELTDGSYTWDITSQWTTTCNDRRKNGVLFGLKPVSAS